MKAGLPTETIDDIIDDADVNGDGCIDYYEFCDLMRSC